MNIKLRDPSHKPKLSLILLRAWVGRKNDNGHLISFYIFGQQSSSLLLAATTPASYCNFTTKDDGWLGKEVVSSIAPKVFMVVKLLEEDKKFSTNFFLIPLFN